jgi:hypothetical protein
MVSANGLFLFLLAVRNVHGFTNIGKNVLTRRTTPLSATSRREALGAAALAWGLGGASPSWAAGGIGAQAEAGSNRYGSVGKIEEYLKTVKNLRRTVASEENELRLKKKEIERVIPRSIEPLIDAMLLNELDFELSEAELQRGAALPQLMKVGL